MSLLSFSDIKLEKWDLAIKDCNCVLNLEADNIKGKIKILLLYRY